MEQMKRPVEEGDYLQMSFSSTECDVYYTVFSENEDGLRVR